jgi:hypothetical protein
MKAGLHSMDYEYSAIPEAAVLPACWPEFQHLLDTYASENQSTYGPTADMTWQGADPTHTAKAVGRK